jgi:hypothetical protein
MPLHDNTASDAICQPDHCEVCEVTANAVIEFRQYHRFTIILVMYRVIEERLEISIYVNVMPSSKLWDLKNVAWVAREMTAAGAAMFIM